MEQGARWIHVVDLDRAFGSGDNQPVVGRLARRMGSKVRIQLGGGMRHADPIRTALDLGVARVVIGTAAALDSSLIPDMIKAWGPARLAVGIDARDGQVALRGWTEISGLRAEELARRVVADGIEMLIYTDIGRDGMLVGPDLNGAGALQAFGAGVIVSGGVAALDDIRAACEAGFAGVIVGKALYEGRLTVPEGIRAATC